MQAEVLDAGARLRLLPRRGTLLDTVTRESETPSRVLTLHRFQRRQGVRIERNPPAIAGLRRADAVRAKLAELAISEQDVEDAVNWARSAGSQAR